MTRSLDLSVLVWEGPQARAYLARMQRAGLRPRRIIVMVHDPIAARFGQDPGTISLPGLASWNARQQDEQYNFHPRAIRKQHPDLVRRIAHAMGCNHKTVGAARKGLETSGEIPQIDRKVGSNGVSYKAPSRPKLTDAESGEIPHALERIFAGVIHGRGGRHR